MLFPETGIKVFGQFLGVNLKCVIDTITHIRDSDGILLIDTKSYTVEFLIK